MCEGVWWGVQVLIKCLSSSAEERTTEDRKDARLATSLPPLMRAHEKLVVAVSMLAREHKLHSAVKVRPPVPIPFHDPRTAPRRIPTA
ncbi:hypothetical protein PAPYR_2641 [Paratrimastix pyriformis]|uniref:Uncharacterized protein n=1 Tax=Paratrimastix pyriformis TaxID=342808 RepID=A0ABQ8UTW4_9EUKA|nr:hypothetical protein PAPYR_2641 [Paratrimastix pyriformis]